MPRRLHPAAIGFLALSALILALGVWAQMQQTELAAARSAVIAAHGAAGFYTVPVPWILQPFEAGWVPGFLYGPDGQATVFGVMAKIGGAFGLLGLLFLSLRGRTVPEAEIEDEGIYQAPSIPAVSGTSDWQRRLAEKMTEKPKPMPAKQPQTPSGLGRMLYRLVLFVVGLAFVGLATVMVLGSQGDAAGVDFTALRNQIAATIQRAMAGDQQAIIRVASVGAAVLGLLIVLRVLFRRKPPRRRDFASL